MKMTKFLGLVLGTATLINIGATMAVKAGEPGADIRRPTAGGIFVNPGIRGIGEAGRQLNRNPHIGGTVRSGFNGAAAGTAAGAVKGGLSGAKAGAAAGAVGGVIHHCLGCHNKSR